jgi:hypothetical protein
MKTIDEEVKVENFRTYGNTQNKTRELKLIQLSE